MKHKINQAGSAGIIALGVVALAIVALVGVKVLSSNNKTVVMTSTAASTNTAKASDLRANLVTMGVEHMMLTNIAVDNALDGNKAATASGTALYSNGTDIGAAVGSVYGPDAEKTFNTVWKLHLDQFVAYAVAGSKGDAAGKTAALSAIDSGYTKPLSQYLAKANPNLPEATVETAFRDHVDMTAKMIDLHNSGDYTGEQAELKMANKHIEGLMSTLAGGIVKQSPQKFQD